MNKNHGPEIRSTRDGSHTLYSGRYSQHYHNPNGAVAESRYVFFEMSGLKEALEAHDTIEILEIGFGTGLNLLLLLDYFLQLDAKTQITYHTVEAYPMDPETARQLNYGDHIAHPRLMPDIASMFEGLVEGVNLFEPVPGVQVRLFNGTFGEFRPDGLSADFIFHDPFSPEANPELWTGKVFEKIRSFSAPDAVLTTYGAASAARGAMASAGWKVARAPGALGKREMTVASPEADRLSHLKRVNEERLAERYRNGDFQK